MFVLDFSIAGVNSLVASLLQKLSKLEKAFKLDNKKTESKEDEFIASTDKKSEYKSTQALLYMLLGFINNEKKKENKKRFNDYLAFLLKEFSYGSAIKSDESFNGYMSDTLSQVFAYLDNMSFEDEDGKEAQARQRARAALSSVEASHPRTALNKLIKIASNSDFPSDIRAIATALVNDALSHMKGQTVDSKSAQELVKLLNSTPSEARGKLLLALRDAKKIKEETRKKKDASEVNQSLTVA